MDGRGDDSSPPSVSFFTPTPSLAVCAEIEENSLCGLPAPDPGVVPVVVVFGLAGLVVERAGGVGPVLEGRVSGRMKVDECVWLKGVEGRGGRGRDHGVGDRDLQKGDI